MIVHVHVPSHYAQNRIYNPSKIGASHCQATKQYARAPVAKAGGPGFDFWWWPWVFLIH